MQLFYDFIPIIIFFAVYKFFGIYAATASAIIVSFLQVFLYRLKHHKFEKMQLITLFLILLLGGATLILHNPIFIKWKPSAIYWAFAIAFLGSHFIGHKPLIRYIMESKITLPDKIWNRLNIGWMVFFTFIGFLNIYVVYHYSTNTWVDFKLFGILGLMILFVIIQAIYLSRHMEIVKKED